MKEEDNLEKDNQITDRHKPSDKRKKDRHRPGYIRPDRREKYTGKRGRPRKEERLDEPEMQKRKRGRPRKESVEPIVHTHVSKEIMFTSWEDFLERTTEKERMDWCRAKANKANRKRLLSDEPTVKLTAEDVWRVLESYKGHCYYCGSLALENRPSKPNGSPLPWEHMGRRIGSLEHIERRFSGGENNYDNLAWACLWCNTWEDERKKCTDNHGGLYTFEMPHWEKEKDMWYYKINETIFGTIRVTPKKVMGQTFYHWNVNGGEYTETTSTSTAKYFVNKYVGELDIRKILAVNRN